MMANLHLISRWVLGQVQGHVVCFYWQQPLFVTLFREVRLNQATVAVLSEQKWNTLLNDSWHVDVIKKIYDNRFRPQ